MNNLLQLFPGNNRIFTRDFTVRYSEVNKFGIIKLQSVFDYLQQAAAEHANSLGFGMNALYQKGMIWVLSKMSINIYGSFHPEQKIRVCTYPSKVERIYFRREFEIIDRESNEILVRSSSFWLLLDAAKLRPLRRETLQDAQLENPDFPVFVENFPTAADDFGDMKNIFNCKVQFSRMDINQHLNNAQYASFAEDAVYEKLQDRFFFEEVNIAFLQAQKYPDELSVTLALKDDGSFKLGGENIANRNQAFSAFGKIKLISAK